MVSTGRWLAEMLGWLAVDRALRADSPAGALVQKMHFVEPGAALALIVLVLAFSAGPGSSGGSAPLPLSAVATEAPAAEAPAVEAPVAEEPEASTCDVVREAILTGSPADITAAMQSLVADQTANATAREYARYYMGGDADNEGQREMDVGLIQMSCTL
jgi:hypothetical protein